MPTPPPRLALAHLPTPVEPMARLSAELGVRIDIKRDDLTGLLLSGNKVRKLEFVLADARQRGATALITCGGVQSNHARATAVAGARLGLRTILLLKRGGTDRAVGAGPASAPLPDGNLFLDSLVGAEIRFIDGAAYENRDAVMEEVACELRAMGETPYVIPEGASNALGAWGYVAMVDELLELAPGFPWTRIVCAVGSGGTLAGLLLGCRRRGLASRVRGYSVHRTPEYFARQVRTILDDFVHRFGAERSPRDAEIEIVGGFEGPAYAEVYPEEVEIIRHVARLEGVALDPVYTGKAFTGMVSDIRTGRLSRDERILFLHTGGLYGLLAQRESFL
jgi:D-cysteine desulfhydrase